MITVGVIYKQGKESPYRASCLGLHVLLQAKQVLSWDASSDLEKHVQPIISSSSMPVSMDSFILPAFYIVLCS